MRIDFSRIRKIVLTLALYMVALVYAGWQQPAFAATGQALIQSTSDAASVSGEVRLIDTEEGLQINATLSNVPSGQHGFHIHEFGSCADAGNAAGGHYNPDGVKHGYLPSDGFKDAHAGDLGNITASRRGTATYSATLPGLALSDGSYPVAGHAFIVHEKQDDFGQPTGNAGGRIGCGPIVLVSPESDS